MRLALLLLFVLVVCSVAAQPVFEVGGAGTLSLTRPKQVAYELDSNVSLNFHVFNATGYHVSNDSTTCRMHLYGFEGEELFDRGLGFDGQDFYTYFDGGNETGVYPYVAWCNGSQGAGFISTSVLVTVDGKDDGPDGFLAALIIAPLAFGIILVVGALSIKDHPVLQAFLVMLSVAPVLSSLHFGLVAVIKFYYWPEMQGAIGTATWWMGMVMFVVTVYWLIYVVVVMFATAAQRKKERFEY